MTESLQFSQILRQWMDAFVHRSMRASAHFVKSSGFSMPQFFLLMHVHHRQQCGISDLSDHLEITNAAVSQLVDKLVQAGLLERAENPHDRRAKTVALSPKGKQFIEQGMEERYRWLERLDANLTAAEQGQVIEALKVMLRAMEDSQ
ncbi:MAG: MarR family transcriptional regulator [Anaerolineales bacterium]